MELIEGKIVCNEDDITQIKQVIMERIERYGLQRFDDKRRILYAEQYLDSQCRRMIQISQQNRENFLFGDLAFLNSIFDQSKENGLRMCSIITITSEDPLDINVEFKFESRHSSEQE